MPLYIAEHQHAADHCPAADPASAGFLLRHLSAPEAAKHGVEIQAEAVESGRHHLVLIVRSASDQTVRDYLAPFAQAGSVDVHRASSCEDVVAQGHC